MKGGRLQCKDIPDRPILEFLAAQKMWATWYRGHLPCVADAMPQEVPDQLIRSKMAKLIRRGLVNGCGNAQCECRGDYEITDKGRKVLQ